jgi:hypothetical protein
MLQRLLETTAVVSLISLLALPVTAQTVTEGTVRSTPKDERPIARPLVPEDVRPPGRGDAVAGSLEDAKLRLKLDLLLVDTVVSNTDPNLARTDTEPDGETSIAINPENPKEIAITSFRFGENWLTGTPGAPLFHSTDGGNTWTRVFAITPPPGVQTGNCPCDQTIDFAKDDRLYGTFLTAPFAGFNDIYSGVSIDPGVDASFDYFEDPPGTAQRTNNNVPSSFGNADQPWLLVNRVPKSDGSGNIVLASLGRDDKDKEKQNVYVAYDNFGAIVNNLVSLQVAVAEAATPPDFDVDVTTGFGGGSGANPGHRLANDPRTGTIYSLFQQATLVGPDGIRNVTYFLNRSTDGGRTWSLNGNRFGMMVANANSIQPDPKFCTVNALLGGIDHAAVDPKTGDVYYAYGNLDAATGNQRLAIRRITTDAAGLVTIGPEFFVSGQVQAAIPSVAVNEDGIIGVFYYTCDGFSTDGFPVFTAHFALSTDQAQHFVDVGFLTFLSPEKDNGDPRQRVLGDYQQVKAVEEVFYGAFTGNGARFGRPISNNDPIFFRVILKDEKEDDH